LPQDEEIKVICCSIYENKTNLRRKVGIFKNFYFNSIIQNHWLLLSFIMMSQGTVEIGLEHAPFVVLVYFFYSFEHAKNLLILGHNNTKSSSLKCDFSHI
jgi:hypothetical protein